MVVTRPEIQSISAGFTKKLALMSDLHFGSPQVDYDLIEQELKDADEQDADILINGDLFDFILPGDVKRFTPDALHPRLQNRTDVVNAAIDWVAEVLDPYRHRIKVIGIGNHETSVEKHHSLDPTAFLINQFNRSGASIDYGDYCGFYDMRFKYDKADRNYFRFTMYRHHGAGGSAPITKGMIDFSRMIGFLPDADLIWIGHKHNRFVDTTPQRLRLSDSGRLEYENISCVMTGGYMRTYDQRTSQDCLAFGRRKAYGADANLPPQRMGGVMVELTFNLAQKKPLLKVII